MLGFFHFSILRVGRSERWRRRWDSNPRYGFPYARFRGEYFQPLSHLSVVVADLIVAERSVLRQSDGSNIGRFRNESAVGMPVNRKMLPKRAALQKASGGRRKKTG